MIKLAQGVRLHIFPTQKYKTVSIKIKFKNTLKRSELVKRSLVTSMIETNSYEYPSQTAFQAALSNLYGARLGAGVTTKGNLHIASFALHVVNDRYIKSEGVVDSAIKFLHSILTKPNASGNQFDTKTFDRELKNLKDDFEAIYDDKQSYAQTRLKELYFTDPAHQATSSGHLDDLATINNQDVFQAYKEMLAKDQIDIYVIGDVDQEHIKHLFEEFYFMDRPDVLSAPFYENRREEYECQTEVQEVVQAKYHLAYDSGIYYQDDLYFASQVFNGLFGGFPHSKLFMNVREKESLAYYASSQLDSFNGVMYISSGIDWRQAEKVLKIINQQLEDMQKGKFNDTALLQTKEMIKNGLLQSDDSAHSTIERIYALSLVGKELSLEEWIQAIEGVTKDEVIQVACKMKLKASFLLKGESTDAN